MNNLKRYTLYIINFIDIISCVLAYLIAYFVRFSLTKIGNPFIENYRYFLFVVFVAYFIVNFTILYKDDDFLTRNSLKELASVMKMTIVLALIVVFYFNFTKMNAIYSRLFEAVYIISLFLIDLILRLIVKAVLNSDKYTVGAEKILLVAPRNEIESIIKTASESSDWRYIIGGIVVSDKKTEEKTIGNIPVVSNVKNMFNPELLNDYDSVIIIPGKEAKDKTLKWLNSFKSVGKKVSIQIPEYDIAESYRSLDSVSGLSVVTYTALSPMSKRQAFLKRVVDLLLSILLLPIFLIVYIIVKVFTSIESSGPIIVKRIRMGKNNRRFYQYRFRLYRSDAKERIEKGLSPFTLIGKFLYTSHLDGLPMILNVFLGDMSFVGPKAPNLPLYLNMSVKERNLLSIKPGIIGYWTGEVDHNKAISDNEDYLKNWSIFKDISIVAYCVLRYLSFRSLRIHGDTHVEEEFRFADQILDKKKHIDYDRSLYNKKDNSIYQTIKRTLDILVSIIAIVILLPVFLIFSILIILDDGGSPFYVHERIGEDGKRINVYKFRSMKSNVGKLEDLLTKEQLKQYNKEFKIDDDPRITKIGNFIRRNSIDELPQLFNILKGDMSIVGPRPLFEEEIRQNYTEAEIAKLLSVKPGLTGYWQAYARNNATYETNERQNMEMYYVDNQSFLFDTKIIFKTVTAVLNKEGAK